MRKPIRFNAFLLNSPTHLAPGMWTHRDDRSRDYLDMAHWLALGRLLEAARFDAIFFADVLGPHAAHGDGLARSIESAAQLPVNDPLPVIAGLSTVTENLCFGFTSSVFAEHPYVFARRISTLDHLTRGRVAWNIVTSYLPGALDSLGRPELADHDLRYDYADEYLSVCYQLWEGSWRDDAVLRDAAAGRYADAARVRAVAHAGRHFNVSGIHLSEPSPQRTPLLFQAGASPRGIRFCAQHAECAFVVAHSPERLAQLVDAIRDRTEQAGRPRDAVRIYAQAAIVVAETDALAAATLADYRRHVDRDAVRALLSGWLGIDFAALDGAAPLTTFDNRAIQSLATQFAQADGSGWTVDRVIDWAGLGGLGPVLSGSPRTVADALEHWFDATGIDGLNVPYLTLPDSYRQIASLLVPELTRRQRYPAAYAPGSFREKLFGAAARVPDNHAAARYRW
ncbi:NtaA/DmoA family FMN-dependent monooxygenase [Burkholderia sp. YIM B11467]